MEYLLKRNLRNLAAMIFSYPLSDLFEYPLFRFGPDRAIFRKYDVAKKVDSLMKRSKYDFLGVKAEREVVVQKLAHLRQEAFQMLAIFAHNYKIIGITGVMLHFQRMFHKLVKFVHIDIGEKLRGEIADRYALARRRVYSLSLSLSLSLS